MSIDISNPLNTIENSIISATKSISADSSLNIEFKLDDIDISSINQELFNQSNISLPKINHDIVLSRSLADLHALYHKFHNNSIHSQYHFSQAHEMRLFDSFEQFRVIIRGINEYRGVGSNLIQFLENNISYFARQDNYLPFLLLNKSPIKSDKIERNIKISQKFITPQIQNKITQLEEEIDNQERFCKISQEIIELFNEESKRIENEKEENQEQNQPSKNKTTAQSNKKKIDQKKIDVQPVAENAIKTNQKGINKEFPKIISDPYSQEIPQTNNLEQIQFINKYKIFTKEFDEIVKARDLSNKNELLNLRGQLDTKLKKLDKISNHLTYKLKRKLLAKKNVFNEHNKEEGLIDRKKISNIITNPLNTNNYTTINQNDYQDTVVSLLLDNSGSMRGSPIVMSALSCEIIAKILERFSIKTEILGFTTSGWHGGKSRKLWESSGKIKNPGRLSDLRHIIYKHADQSFKKSRINLGLMLKEGILKENIDGEALIWAKERLMNRNEKRKILIIISDGTPIDDSTNSNNDTNVLSDHLHHVISKIQKHSNIEIAAIGIGHTVNDFYHNSIMIQNLENLGDVIIDKICNLLSYKRQ